MNNSFHTSKRTFVVDLIKKYWNKFKTGTVGFAEKSWRGAAIGAIIAMIFHLISMGLYLKTGISIILDILLIVLMISLPIFGTAFLTKGLFKIIQAFNPLFVAAFVATYFIAGFFPSSFFSRPLIIFGRKHSAYHVLT